MLAVKYCKNFAVLGINASRSFAGANGWTFLLINLFRQTKSATRRAPPFFLGTNWQGETQSVGLLTLLVTSKRSISIIVACADPCNAYGVFLGVQTWMGTTLTSSLISNKVGHLSWASILPRAHKPFCTYFKALNNVLDLIIFIINRWLVCYDIFEVVVRLMLLFS